MVRPGRPIRIGIIGSGFGAKVHLPGWRLVPGVEIRAVCSARRSRAEAMAAAQQIPVATDDYRELIADPDLDLIDVACHADLHRPIVLAALTAGKHVLCEKPLAVTVDDAREMAAAGIASRAVCAVGFQHRFLPSHIRFAQLVREGFLGDVRCVAASVMSDRALDRSSPLGYWGPFSLRSHGGGILNQLLIHYLDLIRSIFGEVHNVGGIATTTVPYKPVSRDALRTGLQLPGTVAVDGHRPVDADDTVLVHGQLDNDAALLLAGSWVVYHGTGPTVRAHGSDGTVVLQGSRLMSARPGQPLGDVPGVDIRPPNMVVAFGQLATAVVTAMRGEPPHGLQHYPTFDDGVRAQEIVESVLGAGTSRQSVRPVHSSGQT